MDIKKVKVFDAYSVEESKDEDYYKDLGININGFGLFDYHNQIVNKDGFIKPHTKYGKLKPIKPLEKHLVKKDKYELNDLEKMTLKMLKNSTEQAKNLYDSCKRKQNKFEDLLIQRINTNKEIYHGDKWDCNLSPLGYCLYEYDECGGDYICIFCGEPEERK